MPPTTAHILADRALNRTAGQASVTWALAMLEQGYEGSAFCVLACMQEPYNHFEIAELRDQALASLGLADVSDENALHMYKVEIVRAGLSSQISFKQALFFLYELCVESENYGDDFYLLYLAYCDLEVSFDQHYWPDARRENIHEIVKEYFESFVSDAL